MRPLPRLASLAREHAAVKRKPTVICTHALTSTSRHRSVLARHARGRGFESLTAHFVMSRDIEDSVNPA